MTLGVIEPGGFFGEMSLFDGKPRSANVVALEDSVLLVLERAAFRAHLETNSSTAIKLLGEMAERLRHADEIINNLALHDVPSRLVRTLVSLAEANGETREDGILIRRRPTQQDLASIVCQEHLSIEDCDSQLVCFVCLQIKFRAANGRGSCARADLQIRRGTPVE